MCHTHSIIPYSFPFDVYECIRIILVANDHESNSRYISLIDIANHTHTHTRTLLDFWTLGLLASCVCTLFDMVKRTSKYLRFDNQHEVLDTDPDHSNVAGIIQGQKDTPLNDHGRKEAALVSARLAEVPFSELWSSSLSRASEVSPGNPDHT